ncbi:MAG: M20/M25/M40 family metallo-hydrolase, partial [Planctomycetes bacterium]|nr:M20/M25/M40 family metallo-hydrolase [Planctomycetota bacterium]
WDDLPDFPTIMLRRDQISEINAELDKGEEVILEFDIENEFKEGPIPVYNVIADIVGTEFPDEYVIVGGHIDSWDGATGTTDNGTGSATTIEAARLLMAAGAKPKRTIRFMLWSGEEQGLLGSRAWIKDNMDQMEKISAVLVHDGGTNYVSGIIATPTMKEDFERVFAPCIGLNADLPFEISERDGLPGGIGSDHDAFLSEGVPGFFWRQSGRANYTYTHHTQFDTFDAAIPEYQQHTSMVVAIGALGIANLDHMLNRENLRAASTRNRRRLGINVDDDMKLNSVLEDSVAGKAGLKVGDKLISVGKIEIKDLGDLRRAINVDDQKLKVIYEREGKRHEAEAVFPASPTRR